MTTVHRDLSHMFGPVRDQGARPTCLAFAASDAHASVRGLWLPLSCEFLFYHSQKRAGQPPSAGARLDKLLEALSLDGQPEESAWPYLDNIPSNLAHWYPPSSSSAVFRRASKIENPALDDVIAAIDAGSPILILTYLSKSFFRPSKGIVVPAPSELPDYGIRHALVAVGHGSISSQRALLVRNSWGEGWGVSGNAWLTESFIKPRLYAAAILLEDLNVPANSATT